MPKLLEVEQLYLNDNQLTSLDRSLIEQFRNLVKVYLGNNLLDFIPQEVVYNYNIRNLYRVNTESQSDFFEHEKVSDNLDG